MQVEVGRLIGGELANYGLECYGQVPVADELGNDGVLECEAIRNALAAAGISPHHIVMNCSAVRSHGDSIELEVPTHTPNAGSACVSLQSNIIDNIVRLVPVLCHLHIEHVHVVVSQLYLPRAQTCVDRILRAVDDMAFKTQYHIAPDGLQARERAQRETIESRRSRDADKLNAELDDAIKQLKKQQQHRVFEGFYSNSHNSANATRSAARISSTS